MSYLLYLILMAWNKINHYKDINLFKIAAIIIVVPLLETFFSIFTILLLIYVFFL